MECICNPAERLGGPVVLIYLRREDDVSAIEQPCQLYLVMQEVPSLVLYLRRARDETVRDDSIRVHEILISTL